MQHNKISFIKGEVLKNERTIQVVTDKAIVNVVDNFDDCLSMRDLEKLNKSLVFPIHRKTANLILSASKEWDRLVNSKILMIA